MGRVRTIHCNLPCTCWPSWFQVCGLWHSLTIILVCGLSRWLGCSPFLWIDQRGSFHVLAHTWFSGAWPLMTISGHAFSRDGISNWTFAHEEPYSYNVTYTSGAVESFSTLERPKLLFDQHGVATHLYNGVSSQWPCNGTCAGVKTARGRDWTWTMARPLDSALY